MSNRKRPLDYLNETAGCFKSLEVRITEIKAHNVETDIKGCRLEAETGYLFYLDYDQIEAALAEQSKRMTIEQWCQQEIVGLRTMQRRKRLYKNWTDMRRNTERRRKWIPRTPIRLISHNGGRTERQDHDAL